MRLIFYRKSKMKFLVVLAVFILAVSAVTDKEQWLQFKVT